MRLNAKTSRSNNIRRDIMHRSLHLLKGMLKKTKTPKLGQFNYKETNFTGQGSGRTRNRPNNEKPEYLSGTKIAEFFRIKAQSIPFSCFKHETSPCSSRRKN